MNNTNEKRKLEFRDRENCIFILDSGYQCQEPLSMHAHIFDEFDLTRSERNAIILESDYNRDSDLVSTLLLFG